MRRLAEAKEWVEQLVLQGYDLSGIEWFQPDTRHMIVLDVMNSDSPVGFKCERYRFFLSEEEFSELKKEYPGRLQRFIEEMSRYFAVTGRSYHNYAAAMRIWADNDRKGNATQGIPDYEYKEGESL